mgnify:CR=1 FL=1
MKSESEMRLYFETEDNLNELHKCLLRLKGIDVIIFESFSVRGKMQYLELLDDLEKVLVRRKLNYVKDIKMKQK